MPGVVITLLGARMHYSVPRMLHASGRLAHFYTDICAVKGWPRLLNAVPDAMRPAALARLMGRRPADVPHHLITAFNTFGLEFARRRMAARTRTEETACYLWAGERFSRLVVRRGFGDAEMLYAFAGAALEQLEAARGRGIVAGVEQIVAPSRLLDRLVSEEQARFPEWETVPEPDAAAPDFIAREEAEWQAADVILCGSEFVRDGIAACGGPVERAVVVPYGVDDSFRLPPRRRSPGPLRVLYVGAVGLRKGAPYVLEAARRLGDRVQVRMVGPCAVSAEARARLAETVEVAGPVPRSRIRPHFAWADVFLLPSLCEGSATVVYEALAASLPVVCTPNTGSVVRNGVEGFIVPPRDADAVAAALERFLVEPELLEQMSAAAAARARDFGLDSYRRRLIEALDAALPQRPAARLESA